MRIAIIGAGVIGTTVAARLAQRGAKVTLVDQAEAGSGTTSTSFAWLNSNGKIPEAYYRLNLLGLEAHRRLSPTDETGWIGLGGHVEFAADDEHVSTLTKRAASLREMDYGVEEISADEARILCPDLKLAANVRLIVHFTHEAYAYPAKYVAHMLGEARDAGAVIRTGVAVTGLSAGGDGAEVTLADGTCLSVDKVILATGRWTRHVASLAGVEVPVKTFSHPGDSVVGYLATTNPLPVRLSRLVTADNLNIRPAGGGRLLLQALDLDVTADPRNVPGPGSDLAEELLRRLNAVMTGAEGARIEQIVVGQRAMPEDGRTIVGTTPGVEWLYVVATHSGLTLAPYLGDAIADEIFGQQQDAFEDFRIERFQNHTTHAAAFAPRRAGEQ